MGSALAGQKLSVEDFLVRAGEERAELIGGTVVLKGVATGEHSRAQGGIDRRVGFVRTDPLIQP